MNKILVMGDLCTDINYFGEMTRISPEAPIPIFNIKSKTFCGGMSYNVLNNLQNAGNEAILINRYSYESTKHRYFSGKHYLYRIDEDNIQNTTAELAEIFINSLKYNLPKTKAIILQDYNKEFFNETFINNIIHTIRKFNKDVLIIADGHKSRTFEFYKGVDYLKLNEEEFKSLSLKTNEPPLSFVKKGILLTMGERGASLIKKDGIIVNETVYTNNVIDVTGAGDTFTAHFAANVLEHGEEKALKIASIAAGISVQHIGCYAPTLTEVEEYL